LPGDSSPTSRFVRIAFLAANSYAAPDAAGLLNLGEHLINNVDIALGTSRSLDNGKEYSDYTQWVDFKDLTHKKFYYRTYNNLTLREIDLAKLDFSPSATRLDMDIASTPYTFDMTDKFKSTKAATPTMTAKN